MVKFRRSGSRSKDKGSQLIRFVGLFFLFGAIALFIVSFQELVKLKSPAAYEDQGVHDFYPYAYYPIQVENHAATARERTRHPTRIEYHVYYKTRDGSGYKWMKNAGGSEANARIVKEEGKVSRRVLEIPEDDTYITVDAKYDSAFAYVVDTVQRSLIMISAATVYIVGFALFVFLRRRRQRQE